MKLVCAGAVVAVALSVAGSGALPGPRRTTGRQSDGSYVLPTSQELRPAGRQVPLSGRAGDVAVRRDGRTAAVLVAGSNAVHVVDVAKGTVVDVAEESYGPGSARGIAYSPDGGRLFASFARGKLMRFAVRRDGRLGPGTRIPLPKVGKKGEIPTGLAVSPDGRRVYVALNRSNVLGVLDARTGRLLKRVPVGNAPNEVALAGGTLVVSNGGGRRARPGDRTNLSAGTPIVSNNRHGSTTTGTVTLVDARTLRVRAHVGTGLHPSGIAVRGRYAFVANANSDTVSVLDVRAARVVSTISVRPFARAPFGSSANDVATLGSDRLLVTLGRNNALAVYRWSSPRRPARFEGMLPTAWYPADVEVDRRSGRIVVANHRGTGTAEVHGTSLTDAGMVVQHRQQGSVSILGRPSAAALRTGTQTVARNNAWANAAATARAAPRRVAPVAVPARVGEPSLIEHVFYVIKENRTYDQVLGDDPRGNGEPRYVHFGAAITPNQHALAQTFPLFDNFYVASTHSPDAHQWATQAFVTDYNERWWPTRPRSYPFDGGDALVYAPSGFLWENAERHGKSVRVYGEYANRTDAKGTRSDIPSLDAVLSRRYPKFDLEVSDTERMRILLHDLDRDIANQTVPNLTIVQLPLDHTHGTAPGKATPASDVADNDLALGLLVERLSHSPIWPKTAIFVFEDDAQNGLDHVDGTRTTAFVASPYARRGVVDGTFYTQINMIRTIEQILGLPPMNQMDLAATPMTTAFTNSPDPTPFVALPRVVPQLSNPPLAELRGVARAWALACAEMEFGVPDAAPEHLLNRATWYAVKGFDVPYPGDGRVLWPHEVPEPAGLD